VSFLHVVVERFLAWVEPLVGLNPRDQSLHYEKAESSLLTKTFSNKYFRYALQKVGKSI
jgi:hypothetical protein